MKKMIKRIVSCVLFVAILLGLLEVSSFIFQPKSNDKAAGIHYPRANGVLSEPKDSLDAIFIGDSEAYHSFIPLYIWKDYGITSYAISSPAQKLVYSMEFLKKLLTDRVLRLYFLRQMLFSENLILKMRLHTNQNRFFLCSDITTVGKIFSSRIFQPLLNIQQQRIIKATCSPKSVNLRLIR